MLFASESEDELLFEEDEDVFLVDVFPVLVFFFGTDGADQFSNMVLDYTKTKRDKINFLEKAYKPTPLRDSYNTKEEIRYRDWETDRKSTRLNSSHITRSRMPSSA